MNESPEMPEIDPQIPPHAVSVFGQNDAMDDFPVLKAFQQYIDAEQAKSRKRVIMLCVFFICLMAVVIGVFVALIFNVTARNQALNDRLVEYAMRRESQPSVSSAPVVVQPPQDSAALLALTDKLDALQKKFAEDQAKAERAVKAAEERAKLAEAEAAKPKGPSKEEVEIKRLKALLAAEKQKADAAAAAEKERRRQAELEEYRRTHYPEFYEQPKKPQPKKPLKAVQGKRAAKSPSVRQRLEKIKAEVDGELEALSYFDEDEDETPPTEPENEYSIPVEIKGSSTSWKIPND